MKFDQTLIPGKILKRYKRFLADIELEDGQIITAHTANTGSMKTCWEPGWKVLLSYHDNPSRKLKYSLEMTHNGNTWIGINTSVPNKLGVEAIKDGTIKELQGYETIKPEAKIGKSRIDILLKSKDKSDCYVEIKNVTLKEDGQTATFPDAVSERGQKHLEELIQIKKAGMRAVMLYIVQREDANHFRPADHIDPKYSELLKEAERNGVEVLVYGCDLSHKEIKLSRSISYSLE